MGRLTSDICSNEGVVLPLDFPYNPSNYGFVVSMLECESIWKIRKYKTIFIAVISKLLSMNTAMADASRWLEAAIGALYTI